MLTHDAFESKGRKTGLLFPAAPRTALPLWDCEHSSNPAKGRGKQAAPLCAFTQEGILYLKPACSLERSSNQKTTDKEQNRPLGHQSHHSPGS